MSHHEPYGPYGYTPYGMSWVPHAEESLRVAQNHANAAARNVADWVAAGLDVDHFRMTHYRRNKAAEQYAHAVYVERATAGTSRLARL
jgi:hypothetical protein